MPDELDITTMRQQIAASVVKARQQMENYRTLTEMTFVEPVRAEPPRVWFGFIMLVRRPVPQTEQY